MLRWDPEKSTRIKWETTYASELQSRGLTQDFTGLSELLLGQAQPKQFQSWEDDEPTGWWWGSKISDDGNFTELESVVAMNSNSEIPRSYHGANPTIGILYNWFAATAESGKYLTPNETSVDDSICPSGWKLPVNYNQETTDKSLPGLLFGSYQLSNDKTGSEMARKAPLSFTLTGYIEPTSGLYRSNEIGLYSSASTGFQASNMARSSIRTTSMNLWSRDAKSNGYAQRCVKRD